MNVAEVRRRVKRIKLIALDDEAAHSYEDELWDDVLSAIARGKVANPAGVAAAALATKDIAFSRWCA